MAAPARPLSATLALLFLAACGHDGHQSPDPDAAPDHAAHSATAHAAEGTADEEPPCHSVDEEPAAFARSTVDLSLPSVTLTDQQGRPVAVDRLASGERPLAMNFIFATCTTICPVMTATFSQLRDELGDEASKLQMVSVTIDPEHDTPEVLAAYAQRHEAPDDWSFLTGSSADVEALLKATNTWTGSKFNHEPVTLLRSADGSSWTRLEGLGSGAALAEQVRPLLTGSPTL